MNNLEETDLKILMVERSFAEGKKSEKEKKSTREEMKYRVDYQSISISRESIISRTIIPRMKIEKL